MGVGRINREQYFNYKREENKKNKSFSIYFNQKIMKYSYNRKQETEQN